MLRTGWVVVRRTTRTSSSSSSIEKVVSETRTVTVWCLWTRPRAAFCIAAGNEESRPNIYAAKSLLAAATASTRAPEGPMLHSLAASA
jgi:hypothetical protein